MLCHNHYDLMAFTTSGQRPLRYCQDNRKLSHGHENAVVIKEQTRGPGHAINVSAVPGRGISETSRQPLAGAKTHGSDTAVVRAMLACGFSGKNREKLQPQATEGIKI
jgi:hypothetical protein